MYRGASGLEQAADHGDDGAPDAASAAETWTRGKRRLRAELGEDVFASWFARLELDAIVDGCACLTVPTRFLKSWIESHYIDRVLATYRAEAPIVQRISVGVRRTLTRDARKSSEDHRAPPVTVPTPTASFGPRPPAAPSNPFGDCRDAAEFSGAPLDARLTFQSFLVGRSNALAHAAAERVTRREDGHAL